MSPIILFISKCPNLLVDPTKIYLPPLHNKLMLMKNIVAMYKDGEDFQYLNSKCLVTLKQK
jgi:hypothetical protein